MRKKILSQKVPITFTRSKKKRPVTELINEVKAFIASAPSINPLTGMVAKLCHPRVRIFEKSLQPRCSSYAVQKL